MKVLTALLASTVLLAAEIKRCVECGTKLYGWETWESLLCSTCEKRAEMKIEDEVDDEVAGDPLP